MLKSLVVGFALAVLINWGASAAVFRVAGICATSVSFPCGSPDSTVIISGVIEAGDADRFENILRQYGPEIPTVTLRSQGGNVAEAMKIGRLVRSLYIGTRAPFASTKSAACVKESAVLGVNVPCICASACFLIFAGGVDRWGTDILIHRIKFDADFFGGLDFPNAAKTYRAGMERIREYISEMGVPDAFYWKMLNVSSNETLALTGEEMTDLTKAAGGDPAFAEWLDAKCPRTWGFGFAMSVRDRRCHLGAIMKARYEAFHQVLGTPLLTPPDVCSRHKGTILCDPRQP
jgi:hypothetical protein